MDGMKRFFNYLILSILVIGMSGCGDFLEESSLDEVRPSTTDDLEQLLLGEGYLRQDCLFPYLELLTDNVQSNYTPDVRMQNLVQQGIPVYSWDPDMFEKMTEAGAFGIDTWELLYSKIKGCNVILGMHDKVFGEESVKLNQRGQALALRGFYYFLLVNTFAEPYTKEGIDVNKALGVPLILSAEVKDDFPAREPLAKVYGQIETDLLEAVDLLDKYGQDNVIFKVTPLFVYNLLSRVYLYMGNWEKAAEYASVVIRRKPQLRRLADYAEINEFFGTASFDQGNGGVLAYNSPELIWGYGDDKIDEAFFSAPDTWTYPGSLPVFNVDKDFLDSYDANDLRKIAFYRVWVEFNWETMTAVTGILGGQKADWWNDHSCSSRGMRTAEAYLNRAEANIRLFLENGDVQLKASALQDLNYLRQHRYIQPYEDVTEVVDLLGFCLEERRRELAFEDHRWFDLRRCGMPEFVHEYTITEGQVQTSKLTRGSNRYTLPIPKKVLEKNPALIQNPQ